MTTFRDSSACVPPINYENNMSTTHILFAVWVSRDCDGDGAVCVLIKRSCHNLLRLRDSAAQAVIKFELRRLWKCHRALAPGALTPPELLLYSPFKGNVTKKTV